MTATKYRSIPVGRIPRLDRGGFAGSSPTFYTQAVQALMVALPAWAGQALTSNQEDRVRISSAAPLRLVGVKANIPDCLSVDTGSIPVLTAKLLSGVIG